MTFSGAWAARSQPYTSVPLTPGIDPQHAVPDADPNLAPGQSPTWAQNPASAAPDLPLAFLEPLPDVGAPPGGPIDGTNYQDTLGGLGFGNGLDVDQAVALRVVHSEDDGSYASRVYRAGVNRDMEYSAALVTAAPGDGESPQTLKMQQTGVGAPTDQGHSRLSRILHRLALGPIDMHRWEVAFRPLRPNYARPQQVIVASDWSNLSPSTPNVLAYRPAPADRFVAPMVRRTPGDWQEPYTSDGTGATMAAAAGAFGLTSWGL